MTSGQMLAFAFIFIVFGTGFCVFTFVSLHLMIEWATERGATIEVSKGEKA